MLEHIAHESNVYINPIRLIQNSTSEVLQSHFKFPFFYRCPFSGVFVFVIRSAQQQHCNNETRNGLLNIIKA